MLKLNLMTDPKKKTAKVNRVVKKKILKNFFLKKQKWAKSKLGDKLIWKERWSSLGIKLPQVYRKFTAKTKKIITLLLFVVIFAINFILPASQEEKTRQAFLAQPNVFNNRMNMIRVLISNGYFETAKKELNKVGSPEFLAEQEMIYWQENYLFWAHASPQGQRMLINNWQNFLEKYPDYKIGWIYLGYFQLLNGKEEEAKSSFQRAKKIDPSLEEQIKELSERTSSLATSQ